MSNLGVQLFLWILAFASISAIPITLVIRLIRYDTTNYDLEYLWQGQYTKEQLELD